MSLSNQPPDSFPVPQWPSPTPDPPSLADNALIPLTGTDSNSEALDDTIPVPDSSHTAVLLPEDQFPIGI